MLLLLLLLMMMVTTGLGLIHVGAGVVQSV
jgi:hypothetical protein